jgi:hypothetical protein
MLSHEYRKNREKELRAMVEDPVGRLILERKFFEATKSIAPQTDGDLVEAILAHEIEREAVGS